MSGQPNGQLNGQPSGQLNELSWMGSAEGPGRVLLLLWVRQVKSDAGTLRRTSVSS